MLIKKQYFFVALTILFVFLFNAFLASASVQTLLLKNTVSIVSDGSPTYDATTFSLPNNNPGTDASATNNVVRAMDIIVYRIDVSVNDANATDDVITALTLDSGQLIQTQKWESIPSICISSGSSISPDKRTINCLLEKATVNQGRNYTIIATARALNGLTQGQVANMTAVTHSGLITSSATTSANVLITYGFKVDIEKSVPSSKTPVAPDTYPDNYYPDYAITKPPSTQGALVTYVIDVKSPPGGAKLANSSGTTTLYLKDTFIDNRPSAGSSSNGEIYTWGTNGVSGVCETLTPLSLPQGNITCVQPGGVGTQINITLNNVNVNYLDGGTSIAKFKLNLWVPRTDYSAFSDEFLTNTVVNTNSLFLSTNEPFISDVSSGSLSYSEPVNDTNNSVYAKLITTPPGGLTYRKTFYGNQISGAQIKTGGVTVTPGEIVQAGMEISVQLSTASKKTGIACDRIDTSQLEYVGSLTPPFINNIWGNLSIGNVSKVNTLANPWMFINGLPITTSYYFDGIPYGVVLEYSSTPFTSHPQFGTVTYPLRDLDCRDDLDGNALTQDWYPSPSLVPGGASAVTYVRLIANYNPLQVKPLISATTNSLSFGFNFNLKVKNSVIAGSRIGNFMITKTDTGAWTISNTIPTLTSDPGFSYHINYADRLKVVNAKMSIKKSQYPSYTREVKPGDQVIFEIAPEVRGNFVPGTTFTVADALASNTTYVAGSATVVGSNGSVIGPSGTGTLTWTISGADPSLPLPKIRYTVLVSKDITSSFLVNKAIVTSSDVTLNKDSDPNCEVYNSSLNTITTCATAIAPQDVMVHIVTPSNSLLIDKSISKEIYEVNTPIPMTLRYVNNSTQNYTSGRFIDILPYSGDTGNSTLRWSTLSSPYNSGASNFHESKTSVGLLAAPTSTNGEVFTYTKANPTTIKLDPCDASNLANGYVPATGNYCFLTYTLNGNLLPGGGSSGTGATQWCTFAQFGTVGCPANFNEVTAFDFTTTALNSGSLARKISFSINPSGNHENDIYCNNYSGRVPENSLDIISNDVCARVVAGTISGNVWFDRNINGGSSNTESEPSLPGVSVELTNSVGNSIDSDPITPGVQPTTTVTDGFGNYSFANLASGTYKIKVTPPSGYIQTFDKDDGSLAVSYSTPNNSGNVVLRGPNNPGALINPTDVEDNASINFAYTIKGSVGNQVFIDKNKDGMFNVLDGDSGVSGVQLSIYKDVNNDGLADGVSIATTTTDGFGIYTFNNLPVDDGSGSSHYIVKVTGGIPNTLKNYINSSVGASNIDSASKDANGYGVSLSTTNISNSLADFGYYYYGEVSLIKTGYKGFNAGVSCPGSNEIVIVDKNKNPAPVTYCFEVKNTGPTYLTNIQISDPLLNVHQADLTLLSGIMPLAPNANAIFYFETSVTESITNTASLTVETSDNTGVSYGHPPLTASDPAGVILTYIYDPPSSKKIGVYQSDEVVQWRMVWINSASITANGITISDEIPDGSSYITDSLECLIRGSSKINSCNYETPSITYPRGRIIYTGSLGPDQGKNTEETANNELVILFNVKVPKTTTNISNQAQLSWDQDLDGISDYATTSDDPDVNGANDVTVARFTKKEAHCGDSAPSNKPRILSITRSEDNTKATIKFLASDNNVTHYIFWYGLYSTADIYNITYPVSENQKGILTYTINALDPKSTYYIKIEPFNGCKSGEKSDILGSYVHELYSTLLPKVGK